MQCTKATLSLSDCKLCPRYCGVDRTNSQLGFCRCSAAIKVARAGLHSWEEPCISGNRGSGTVFFSGCNLKCVFCQNYEISHGMDGKEISPSRLSEIFLELQAKGAHNINLVTPTHYVPGIINALQKAKKDGLKLPIIYNSSGYEAVETLKMLEGLVDIYLPDIKYFNDKYAAKYSNAPGYFKVASSAVEEMFRQVGRNIFDNKGIMSRGMIIRHLMLPGLLFDSKKIIDYIYGTFKDSVYISLMNQYIPMYKAKDHPEINSALSPILYEALVDYCISNEIENVYIQEEGADSEAYIPKFDGSGI